MLGELKVGTSNKEVSPISSSAPEYRHVVNQKTRAELHWDMCIVVRISVTVI